MSGETDGASTPSYHLDDDEVAETAWDYSDRAPDDFVISGPLPDGWGPGRPFESVARAARWCRLKYGYRFRRMITEAESGGRWAALIRRMGD
jgi:hypothetical protein